jgi:hypothetical protein
MKIPALIASLVALALTIVPPVLFLSGSLADGSMKSLMLAGTILWFIAWPLANPESS